MTATMLPLADKPIVLCPLCDKHSADPCNLHDATPLEFRGGGCKQKLRPDFYEHPELDIGVEAPTTMTRLLAQAGAELAQAERYVTPHKLPNAHERELLDILIEECAEVIQRATKALRFGLSEIQPGQPKTSAERLANEIGDIDEVVDRLVALGSVAAQHIRDGQKHKKLQLDKYMQTKPGDL